MGGIKRNETNSTEFEPGHHWEVLSESVPVAELRAHPDNTYKVEPDGVRALAENIREVGLIQPVAVRRVADGGLQLLAGHRRKAAFDLLRREDPAYEMIDARVYYGLSDADALLILHSSNIARSLSAAERKRQVEELETQVAELREYHPEWHGIRTSDVIAGMLGIGSTTWKRRKRLVLCIEPELMEWHERGLLSVEAVDAVKLLDRDEQVAAAKYLAAKKPSTKREVTALLKDFNKPVSSYLSEFEAAAAALDASWFRLREAMEAHGRTAYADLSRIEAVRDKLDSFLDGCA